MAIVPVVPTKAVGDLVTAADWNDWVKGTRDFLIGTRPLTQILQGTAQTGWTSGTYTAITFTNEDLDRDGTHSTTVNTSRILIGGTLGWWRIGGMYAAPANAATTILRAAIALNGTRVNGSIGSMTPGGAAAAVSVDTKEVFVEATASGDYVELYGWQTAASGTIGTQVSGGDFTSLLTAEYLGT